jgi:hypothetical protein
MNLPPQKKSRRCRKDIIYRLRKKGFRLDTKARTVYFPSGENPDSVAGIKRLRYEFNFNVQLEI